MNKSMKTLTRSILSLILCFFCLANFTSCKNEAEKRSTITKIIENRTAKDLLNDLYIGSDGNVEEIARMLKVTPSSIERIRTGATLPTEDFDQRIKDISIYYALNNHSYQKLRHAIDDEWGWYDTVLRIWPRHWLFWVINILIIILVIVSTTIEAALPIVAEMLVFLIAWIALLICSPKPMEDRYVDSINPVIEQLL